MGSSQKVKLNTYIPAKVEEKPVETPYPVSPYTKNETTTSQSIY